MTELYRLVYTSRNLLEGSDPECAAAVADILATSQTNNSRVAVTGALLFNRGSFAQVLEGPRPVIETTFERIQRDRRHSDVAVLQCEPVTERGFPNWSMAFVGHSAKGRALWDEMAGRTGFDLSRIEGEDLFATLHAIVLAEEGLVADGPKAAPPPARSGGEGLDVGRLREELRGAMPEERPRDAVPPPATAGARPVPVPQDAEAAVLRAAIAAERARTTDLRRELDDARIALAVAEREADELRRERDLWAGRTRALASLMAQDAEEVQAPETLGRAA